ncbi:hypothetical protein PROFUN_07692 [Planoprotostelium fungivorum]|uniref:Uncharacterized protein n=1 Tax=Planoprotostelium fungivorum TaxID=1890364 RepID=A0A2P6MM71_9EUKA|nr:hypothetical protein PROFUN_07692 [Planoprotostelium fungivorum]
MGYHCSMICPYVSHESSTSVYEGIKDKKPHSKLTAVSAQHHATTSGPVRIYTASAGVSNHSDAHSLILNNRAVQPNKKEHSKSKSIDERRALIPLTAPKLQESPYLPLTVKAKPIPLKDLKEKEETRPAIRSSSSSVLPPSQETTTARVPMMTRSLSTLSRPPPPKYQEYDLQTTHPRLPDPQPEWNYDTAVSQQRIKKDIHEKMRPPPPEYQPPKTPRRPTELADNGSSRAIYDAVHNDLPPPKYVPRQAEPEDNRPKPLVRTSVRRKLKHVEKPKVEDEKPKMTEESSRSVPSLSITPAAGKSPVVRTDEPAGRRRSMTALRTQFEVANMFLQQLQSRFLNLEQTSSETTSHADTLNATAAAFEQSILPLEEAAPPTLSVTAMWGLSEASSTSWHLSPPKLPPARLSPPRDGMRHNSEGDTKDLMLSPITSQRHRSSSQEEKDMTLSMITSRRHRSTSQSEKA